jgi:hypothetical protein
MSPSSWPIDLDPDLSRGGCWLFWTALEMLRQVFGVVVAGLAGLSWQAPSRAARDGNAYGPLQFRSDGYFQVAIFEDLHFGESTALTHLDLRSLLTG